MQHEECLVVKRARLGVVHFYPPVTFLRGATWWEAGGLGGGRPMALNTVRRSRQLPCMAPSIEASSFLISSQRSDWRVVRGGVVSTWGGSQLVFRTSGAS